MNFTNDIPRRFKQNDNIPGIRRSTRCGAVGSQITSLSIFKKSHTFHLQLQDGKLNLHRNCSLQLHNEQPK